MNSHAHALDKLALFSGIPDNVRKEFLRAGRYCRFAKGETVFLHADPAASFFILVRGAVRLHRQTPQGAEIIFHLTGPGDMLAGYELFEGRNHYQTSATAIMNSELLIYSPAWVKNKIRECPEFAINMLAALSQSASRTIIDREQMFALDVSQRVGCHLIQICDRHHLDPKLFFLPYSKAIIASRLGIPPESFSRALTSLKKVGISVKGDQIRIADLSILDKYACGSCSVAWDCKTRLRLNRRYLCSRNTKT